MGTLRIEQYAKAGTGRNGDQPVPHLSSLLKTDTDSSTSSTAESLTLESGTNLISVVATETHRVSATDSTAATIFATINEGTVRDFAIDSDDTLYYRTDA